MCVRVYICRRKSISNTKTAKNENIYEIKFNRKKKSYSIPTHEHIDNLIRYITRKRINSS